MNGSDMRSPFASFKRIGKYRIVNAESRWGIDLFDDLCKLSDPSAFRVVFDVGANVGNMSELFMKHFPGAIIHAFEPVNSTFAKLQHRLGQHPRLALHNFGASDLPGTAHIRLFNDSAKNTLISGLADSFHNNSRGLEKIELVRLDTVVSEMKIDSIDLLKIDVEGFEANVLHGCGDNLTPARIRYVYLEFHRVNRRMNNGYVAETGHSLLCSIDRMLESNGYRLLVIYTQGVHRGEAIGTYNALYGIF
jgi:FkbM family methyltransferase